MQEGLAEIMGAFLLSLCAPRYGKLTALPAHAARQAAKTIAISSARRFNRC